MNLACGTLVPFSPCGGYGALRKALFEGRAHGSSRLCHDLFKKVSVKEADECQKGSLTENMQTKSYRFTLTRRYSFEAV